MTAKVHAIIVRQEATCKICGKPFAITEVNGEVRKKCLCLDCMAKDIGSYPLSGAHMIGEKTLAEVKHLVEGAMRTYLSEINETYLAISYPLTLRFAVKLSPGQKSDPTIDLSFGFVTGWPKNTPSSCADKNQLSFFRRRKGKRLDHDQIAASDCRGSTHPPGRRSPDPGPRFALPFRAAPRP